MGLEEVAALLKREGPDDLTLSAEANERPPSGKSQDSNALIERQCAHGPSMGEIRSGAKCLAVVLDAAKEFGLPVAVRLDADGTQVATVKVASKEGCFVSLAKTQAKGAALSPGNIVVWSFVKQRLIPSIWAKVGSKSPRST